MHSSYDALHVRFQHRLTYVFTLLNSYAYGKSIDNGSGVRTTDGDALTPSDNYKLRAERGLSAFHFKHRWTNSFLYELPFGKGKPLMGGVGAIGNAIVGGWQLGGILTFESGFPASIFCGSGNWQNNDTTCSRTIRSSASRGRPPNTSTYGVIGSTRVDSRGLQLAL